MRAREHVGRKKRLQLKVNLLRGYISLTRLLQRIFTSYFLNHLCPLSFASSAIFGDPGLMKVNLAYFTDTMYSYGNVLAQA